MSETVTGTVKWFNETKGYGFITPNDGSKDVFAHANEIAGDSPKSLDEGQTVEFTVTESPKGLQASNIRPA